MQVKNSTVLITGANRGIGKAYAEEFLKAGAKKIYLGVRDPASVEDMVAANPKTYAALRLDVTDPIQIKNAVASASDINILINNAGILFADDMRDPEAAEHARLQFETNYVGPLALTQAFTSTLKKNGGGAVITVSSIAGHVAFPGLMTYSASKFAAHALILGMRQSSSMHGIRIIGVYPGPIDTDMAKDIPMDKVPPAQVALETIKALESNQDDVFPDPIAKDLYQALRNDPKALESQLIEQAQEAA